jgi:hypothetical protein
MVATPAERPSLTRTSLASLDVLRDEGEHVTLVEPKNAAAPGTVVVCAE